MLESAEIANDPLVVIVQVRDSVLARDIETAPELGVLVEQAIEMDQGDAMVIRSRTLSGSGASSKSTVNPESPGHSGLSWPIENAGGCEPHTIATVFVIVASLVRAGARARPCCRRRAPGHRLIRRPDGLDATPPPAR